MFSIDNFVTKTIIWKALVLAIGVFGNLLRKYGHKREAHESRNAFPTWLF